MSKRYAQPGTLISALRPTLIINWWKIWKTPPVVSWIRGAELFKEGNFKSAATHYRRGLNRKRSHKAAACARLDLGYCLYQLGDLSGALQELSTVVKGSVPLKDAYLLLSKLQLSLGRTAEGIETMKRCLSLFPDDVQATLCYAYGLFTTDAPAKQLTLMKQYLLTIKEKLSLTDPLTVSVDTALATYELRYGEKPLGEQLLARVLASGVAPFEAILLRGEQWLKEGRLQQSRDQLERAMKAQPQDPRPLMLLARTYLADGENLEPDYAAQLATAACGRSNWENAECLTVLAEAYEHLDDPDTSLLIQTRLAALTNSDKLTLSRLSVASEDIQKARTAKLPMM